jgi:hypothetical protein
MDNTHAGYTDSFTYIHSHLIRTTETTAVLENTAQLEFLTNMQNIKNKIHDNEQPRNEEKNIVSLKK